MQEQPRVGDDESLNPIMKLVWIPSKVKLFCWRLFLDWLSTRSQLSKKGILLNDHERVCAPSFNHEEDSSHLMLQCVSSKRIWQEINVWLDSDLMMAVDSRENFLISFKLLKGKVDKNREGLYG